MMSLFIVYHVKMAVNHLREELLKSSHFLTVVGLEFLLRKARVLAVWLGEC